MNKNYAMKSTLILTFSLFKFLILFCRVLYVFFFFCTFMVCTVVVVRMVGDKGSAFIGSCKVYFFELVNVQVNYL